MSSPTQSWQFFQVFTSNFPWSSIDESPTTLDNVLVVHLCFLCPLILNKPYPSHKHIFYFLKYFLFKKILN